ncbi:hypothetical protein Y1Q_0010623 [Alligator mississippiensis]|uniref:Uncharacterized protein n=1 Tax=Alligator mississippiensis TaxID=8496 RepID=A0A151PGU6_ALLMI|nr:hypothetical protein Y1Q_0010623 [Alligator mississippiensis]
MAGIAPRALSPGTDIFANRHGCFVVRSDLGCFVWASDSHAPASVEVRSLHPACQGGEHYVGDAAPGSSVCILRGDVVHRATDLSTAPSPDPLPLHAVCCGGDHYAAGGGRFFVIFLARGVVLSVADLTTGAEAKEMPLVPAALHGLYYYASAEGLLAFLDVDGERGLCSHLFSNADCHEVLPVHPDVTSFFPGGLALVHGPAFGTWECVKLIQNDTDVPLPGSHDITRKVGHIQEKLANWTDSTASSPRAADLAVALLQAQFSLPAAYGGVGLQTEQEEWEAVAEEDESLRVILQPRQKLYWWQYVLGLGHKPLLFCRSLKVTRSPSPPTHVPLPRADVRPPEI